MGSSREQSSFFSLHIQNLEKQGIGRIIGQAFLAAVRKAG